MKNKLLQKMNKRGRFALALNKYLTGICPVLTMTLILLFTMGTGEMWGQTLIEADDFETTSGSGDSYAISGFKKGDCTISQSSEARTGSYSIKTEYNDNNDKTIKTANTSISVAKNAYLHCIGYAKMESSDGTAEGTGNQATGNSYVGGNGKGTYVNLKSASWLQFTSVKKASSPQSSCYVLLQRKHSAKKAVLFDDVVIYVSTNETTDVTAPTAASSASATTSSISWTNGSDTNTGRQYTSIWRRTSGSSDDLTLNNQGVYTASATDQSGHWTCVSATVAAGTDAATSSYDGTFSAGDRYAIVHRDLAYNYSSPTYVTITASEAWGIGGSMNSWTPANNEMTGSDGVVSATIELDANIDYTFKVVEIVGDTWYGNGEKFGGTKTQSVSSTGTANNCHLLTSEAGDYTFEFNTSTKALTITYPNTYTVYYSNTDEWSKVYAYKYTQISSNTGESAAWPGEEITDDVLACGGYNYTSTDGYATIIFNDNNGHQTGNMASASGDGKYVAGTGSSWTAMSTFSVTYDDNGAESGDVPEDDNDYDCGENATVLGNTGSLTKAGYSFNGWNTKDDGSGIAKSAGATYEISGDVTFYAQWLQEVPDDVDISGTTRCFPGQTISLTATPDGGTSDFGYQWQKYKGSSWTNLANGTDAGGTFSGATTANLQISGCTAANSGSYRCIVSKLGASVTSDSYAVHVFTLEGDYNGGSSWTSYDIEYTSGNAGKVDLSLNAGSLFEFGIKDNFNNTWYRNTGFIIDNWTNEGCGSGSGNCRLFTGPAGSYRIAVDYSHAFDGSPYVQISVTYPTVTHPVEGYTYFEKPGGWDNVKLYWYTDNSNRLTSWEDAPQLTNTATICGKTYYYSPLSSIYSYVIYRDNGSNKWPTDGLSTTGCSGKHMDETDYDNPAWAAFETYTITFAGNGSDGGSMTDVNGICPSTDQALSANGFTKTGHTFGGWKTDVALSYVPYGGGDAVNVAVNGIVPDKATIKSISGDITLTAQWTANEYDITYMDGESEFAGTHADGHPTTHTYGSATALKSATKTGYTLEGWYTEAGLENKVTSLGATAFTDDITLYAKWTADTYDITYMDGESAFAGTHADGYPTTHTYGTATTLKGATKTGYTLEGWYTEVGLENKVTSLGATAYTDDITLYAKWTANSYTLTLDDNGGSADGSGTVQTLGTSFSPSAPTYSGYTVEGYYTSANCTTKVATAAGALQASITVSEVAWTNSSSQWTKNGDATFYAKWKANTPTITCSKNKVTITGPTGATIYYTTDGSTTPTSSSTEYTGAFDIDETITVKAIAITSGDEFVDSDVASEECEAATLVTASWPMIANDTVTLNGSATTSVLTTSRVVKAGMGDITTALSVSYTDYTEKMAQVPTIGTVGEKGAVTDTSYVKYTITVAYGYTFTPTGFSAIVGRIGTDNGYAQAVLKTGSTTIKSSTASNPNRSRKSVEKTVYSASFDDASTYSAGTTIDLYIYFGGAMASGKSYVVSEVSITGEYAEVQIVPSFTSPASDPDDVEYTVGDLIEQLEVVATGSPTPTLQWYKNTANSTSSPTPVAITDSTNATFTPSNASASDLYYFCRATNSAGSADSRIFHVTVNAAPTYDATYDENGHGTAPDDEEEVTDVTLPQIDAVSGWRHTAWTADQDVKIGGVTIDAGEELEIGAQAYLTDDTKFTAVWTATYAVAEGTHSNGSISISPTVGIAGETIEIEATANDDYLFDEWQIVKTSDATDVTTTLLGDNKSKASTSFTLPAYGVTINATFVEIDYCATMAINTSSTGALAVDNAVPTTGTATAKVVGVGDASSLYVDGYGLSFTKTGDKIEVTLPNVMVEGSIICIELYNGAANAGRGLTIQATDNTDVADIVYDFLEGGAKKLYYTVKSTDTKLIGKNQFRITRYSNVRLKSLSVGECGGKYIEPVLTYDNTTLYTDGTPSSASATLTGNKGSGAVTYSVSPTGVVSINASTGAITAVATGSATVTASVAAANGYIAATATCGITVKGCGYEQIAKATLSSKTAASDATGGTALISGLSGDSAPYKLNSKPSYFGIQLSSDFEVGDSVIFKLKVGDFWSGASASELPVVVFADADLAKEIYRTDNLTAGTNNVFVRFVITQDMIDDGGLEDKVMIWRTSTNTEGCTECCTQNHQMYSVQIKRATCSSGMIKPIPGISDANWDDASSWIGGVAPTIDDHVVITNNMTVNTTTAVAKEIEMTDGATLTISAGKALIVAKSITKSGSATTVGDIKLGSSATYGNAALVMGHYDGTNEAEVEFYTKAGKNAKGEWVNQFIGTPYNDESYVKTNFYGAQIYEFRAAQDGTYPSGNDNYWTRLSDDGDMAPFMGYNLLSTQTAGSITLDMNGKLVRTDQVVEKTMYYNGSSNTENMFANSWVAPIHIRAFETEDFGGGEATIYIFNAGTPEDAYGHEMGDGSADNNSPGQYIVLPIASSTWLSSTTVTVIPAMQAFSVFATAANQTLSLDYNKLVYKPALDSVEASKGIGVIPTRAKKNEVAPEVVKLHVSAVSGYAANAFVLGREDFTEGFDNGWDGRYMEGNEEAPQLYSLSADGDMTVNCVPDVEGTVLGFKAGTVDEEYTMTFEYEEAEALYLLDTYKNIYTRVETGNSYTFHTDDVSPHNRFILTRYRSPQIATDLEPTPDPSLKGRENGFKFVEDQKIYILYRGVLYDATGKRVEERRNQK